MNLVRKPTIFEASVEHMELIPDTSSNLLKRSDQSKNQVYSESAGFFLTSIKDNTAERYLANLIAR